MTQKMLITRTSKSQVTINYNALVSISTIHKVVKFSFFLVLCLPRQIRTSNGVIHHHVQLSSSTSCNIFSSSSNIILILGLPLFFFPSILPSTIAPLFRGVQYVHWAMHKCIMVKVGGKNAM